MKKVSKKVESTKLNDSKYHSLNGEMLKKIKGGTRNEASKISDGASTDRLCGGCGATAAF
ncbi:hypothetical protein [Marinifilum sp.]|uniref:hypothetical protein n=1 Tax=Marinifilum sp. TaxID=2033137 RepID=UPI003BACDF70